MLQLVHPGAGADDVGLLAVAPDGGVPGTVFGEERLSDLGAARFGAGANGDEVGENPGAISKQTTEEGIPAARKDLHPTGG